MEGKEGERKGGVRGEGRPRGGGVASTARHSKILGTPLTGPTDMWVHLIEENFASIAKRDGNVALKMVKISIFFVHCVYGF